MSLSHSNKVIVGISSRSSERDLQWLMDFIRRTFPGLVSDVRYLAITNSNWSDWEANVRRCSVGILYHTKHQGRLNIVDVDGALYDKELLSLAKTLGKRNVLVVLDDLENCSDSEKERIWDAQPSLRRLSSQLFLFSEEGKKGEAYKKREEFYKFLGNSAPPQVSQANTTKSKGFSYPFMNLVSEFMNPKGSKTSLEPKHNSFPKEVERCKQLITPRLKIGIFSRSVPSNYEWLVDWLKTSCMMRAGDIHTVHITNNPNTFYSELPNCTFAILYHTQKEGRINITDVTDSLYNEELEELSKRLKKENVIVVIDDLQNTNTAEKNRILENQPTIGRLTRDLFLFKEGEKNSENLERIKKILKGMSLDQLNGQDKSLVVNKSASPRQAAATYSSSNPSSDFRMQPSTSGGHGRHKSPSDNPEEEPELKRPFVRSNLELLASSAGQLEELCSKGAPFFEAFNKINDFRLIYQQAIQEIERHVVEMEKKMKADGETIKHQHHLISTLIDEGESKNQSIRSKDTKMQQMESEREAMALERTTLRDKLKYYESEGEEKDKKLQNKELVIRDLQKKGDEMQSEIRRLKEMLERESQKRLEEKNSRQMNTMRQKEDGIKGRHVSCVDPKEHPRMDEDGLIDREEHSTHAAHGWQDEAESMKRRIKGLEMRIQELEIELQKEKQNAEETLRDILEHKM